MESDIGNGDDKMHQSPQNATRSPLSRWLVALCLGLLLVATAASPARAERSYSIDRVEMAAEVLPDGSMQVSEQYTVHFHGTYSGMFRWIYKRSGMSVVDVAVEEGGMSYRLNPETQPGPADTFFVEDGPDRVKMDWSFDATDQVRTFILRYRVLNAVVVHDDVAELYYKFFGEESDHPFEHATVRLTLPAGAELGDVRAWGHGPLHGNVEIKSPQAIVWDVAPLPAYTFLEGRVVFPPTLVPGASMRSGHAAMPTIQAEEERWAEEANRTRRQAQADKVLAVIAGIAGVGLCAFLGIRFRRKYRPAFTGDYYRELPAAYTPGELGALLNWGQVGPVEFTATIVDLARRGYLRLEEFLPEKTGLFSRKRTDYRILRNEVPLSKMESLKPHEEAVLDFVGEASTFRGIEAYAKEYTQEFMRFWKDWQSDLREEARRQDFFDRHAWEPRLLQVGIGLLLLVGGFVLIMTNFILAGLVMMVVGAVNMVVAAVLRRRSARGTEDYARWMAFRRFLKDFSNMERYEIPALAIWEHYLVYAIPLGVAKTVLNQLPKVYPNLEDDGYRFAGAWYWGTGGTPSLSGMSSALETMVHSMEHSIRHSLQAASSDMSSGGGFGGGFSGGGGGGGGGGGVGAR